MKKKLESIPLDQPEKMTEEQRDEVLRFIRHNISFYGNELAHLDELLESLDRDNALEIDVEYWQNYADYSRKQYHRYQQLLKIYETLKTN